MNPSATPRARNRRARKVLFFSDAPYEGGAERYIEYLIGCFPDHWKVSVVARERRDLDAWATRLARMGARIVRSRDTTRGLLGAFWRLVRSERPDVVHLNLPHSYSAFYSVVAPLARLAGARSVVSTEHLTMIAPMRLRGCLRRAMTRAIDRIITISESNRRDLTERHRLPADRVRVVFNGVPAPEAASSEAVRAMRDELGVRGTEVLIAHLGALTERKGHRLLLAAAARLSDMTWRMAFVGEGEERAALQQAARELGVLDRVVFAGHREDIGVVLGATDVLVLPSRLEGMPLVLLEAMALGRPAIATTVYGVPEIYGGTEAAILVPYGDVEALVGALRRLVGEPRTRARMGEAGRKLFAERFTAQRMAMETLGVYEEVLA